MRINPHDTPLDNENPASTAGVLSTITTTHTAAVYTLVQCADFLQMVEVSKCNHQNTTAEDCLGKYQAIPNPTLVNPTTGEPDWGLYYKYTD